jgi:FkbM family methyltransferase
MIKNKLSQKIFDKYAFKINVIDAGNDLFNGGRSSWKTIGKENLRIWGFDGDESLVQLKNQEAKNNNWDHVYFSNAVADANGRFTLYYSENETHGSGFLPNYQMIKPWNYDGNISMYDHMYITDSVELNQVKLDDFLGNEKFDFIKLNIQGSELDALMGFNSGIDNCVGVEVEVPFNQYYMGAPNFGDIDRFLKSKGFYFFDILAPNIVGYKNSYINHHPTRLLSNHNFPKKQLFEAHVLYLKNPLIDPHGCIEKSSKNFSLEKILKLAIIAEGYGQLEYVFALMDWLINECQKISECARAELKIFSSEAALYYKSRLKFSNLINRVYRRINMILGNSVQDII